MPDGRILIVDDQSELGRWMTESVLQPAGFAFTLASTLMQVLELVSSFKPHVILLNAHIDSDLTVVKRVITEFDGSIPTIVFAERCSLDDLASMLQAGARDVRHVEIERGEELPLGRDEREPVDAQLVRRVREERVGRVAVVAVQRFSRRLRRQPAARRLRPGRRGCGSCGTRTTRHPIRA